MLYLFEIKKFDMQWFMTTYHKESKLYWFKINYPVFLNKSYKPYRICFS